MQLAYAKITVYCNLSLAVFHLGCHFNLNLTHSDIFKGGIPRFMTSGCKALTLSSEFLLPPSHSL